MPTQIIEADECMRLLATQTIGRFAVVAGRYPTVVPVNFALDHGIIVFRTGPGAKLESAQHRNVAFQAHQTHRALGLERAGDRHG